MNVETSTSSRPVRGSGLLVRWLPCLVVGLLVLRHFWLVGRYAVDIPYQDEIFDFLRFINLVEGAESLGEHFSAWFSFHNEHRTTASRLQVYLAYLVEGKVDFRTHAMLGNASLPLMLWLFHASVRRDEHRWWMLLVPALLMLTLRPYTIVSWGQPTFGYFWVYFYAFACVFALHRVDRPRFLLAVTLAVLASLTFSMGLVVWVVGLAFLLQQAFVSGRVSRAYPAAWLFCTLVVLPLWAIGFESVQLAVPTGARAAAARAFDPRVLVDPTPLEIAVRFVEVGLVILGRAVTESSVAVASLLAVFVLAVLSYVSVRRFRDDDLRLLLCAWFAVGAVAAVSVGRALAGSPEYVVKTNTRYSFLSIMALSTLSLAVLTKFRAIRMPLLCALLPLAVAFHVWSQVTFEPLLRKWTEARYEVYNQGRFPVVWVSEEETSAVVREASEAGRIDLPCRPAPECEALR